MKSGLAFKYQSSRLSPEAVVAPLTPPLRTFISGLDFLISDSIKAGYASSLESWYPSVKESPKKELSEQMQRVKKKARIERIMIS
jgi:hypothetical protein